MQRFVCSFVVLMLGASTAVSAPVFYTSRAAFLAAAGPGLATESFESSFGTAGTINFTGFSMTESGPGSIPAIASLDSSFASSLGISNSITDGSRSVGFDDNDNSIITNLFSPTINAFGWDVTTSGASSFTITVGSESFTINLGANSPAFIGVIDSTGTFSSLVFEASGGPNVGFDNAVFGNAEAVVPEPISLVVFGGLIVGGGLVARKRLAKKAVA